MKVLAQCRLTTMWGAGMMALLLLIPACGDSATTNQPTATSSSIAEDPAVADASTSTSAPGSATTTVPVPTVPPATTSAPASTAAPPTSAQPTTTSAPPQTSSTTTTLAAVSEQPSGLFCRDLAALGYDYAAAVAYWEGEGEPERMDADRNGVPCETVYPEDVIAAMFGPGGARALVSFFVAARDLDAQIAAAAAGFNAGFDAAGPTLDPSALPAIEALDAAPLGRLIPAGMALNLETALLAVYTDLDSRIAALQRGAFSVEWADDAEQVLFCLRNGSASNARFDADLAAAEALARDAPKPTAAPDSAAAGILQVRLDTIRLWNWGCDSCGGATYDEPLSVDWEGRTINEHQVEFSATFVGERWQIQIAAC